MQLQKKDLPESQIELSIEVSADEAKTFLIKAASRLAERTKFEGFRPGKAPYDIVKQRLGEMSIYQEALDNIISHFFWQAVTQEQLNTVSQPKIDLEKFAPGNPIIFKATVALLPQVTVGSWQKIKVAKQEIKIQNPEVDQVIEDLRKHQVKETLVSRPAQNGDRVEIDFTVALDKVVIEDGTGKKYPLVIGDKMMIPGFEEPIIGMNQDEEKTFQLQFPEKYQNSMIAGKRCDFKVKLLSVYQRELPPVTDEWAKGMGTENVQDLKSKIKKNLEDEQKFHEEQRWEAALLKEIVAQSQFSEIPEVLVDNEAHRMIHEFEDSIAAQGIQFEDYLKNIKKEKKDLSAEFRPKAMERVKTSLIIRAIADAEKVVVTEPELKQETEKILAQVQDNQEATDNIRSEGYQHYLQTVVRNRKVIELLKKAIGQD